MLLKEYKINTRHLHSLIDTCYDIIEYSLTQKEDNTVGIAGNQSVRFDSPLRVPIGRVSTWCDHYVVYDSACLAQNGDGVHLLSLGKPDENQGDLLRDIVIRKVPYSSDHFPQFKDVSVHEMKGAIYSRRYDSSLRRVDEHDCRTPFLRLYSNGKIKLAQMTASADKLTPGWLARFIMEHGLDIKIPRETSYKASREKEGKFVRV